MPALRAQGEPMGEVQADSEKWKKMEKRNEKSGNSENENFADTDVLVFRHFPFPFTFPSFPHFFV